VEGGYKEDENGGNTMYSRMKTEKMRPVETIQRIRVGG
jgi:hypothetical protein